MSSNCSKNCSHYSDKCSANNAAACPGKEETKENKHPQNDIKHVIAVMSGKGGVGKSTVTSLLASALKQKGSRVGILDADITGPSIPKLFGVQRLPQSTESGILPVKSKGGIKIMSINLLLPHEDEPVIWRGPVISGVIKQFWNEVIWGDLDYLLVDLPPGTGDAPLTVLQNLPLTGVVIVSSPQDLANMVVRKAINMAKKMNIKILGLVENMSFIQCPGCREKIYPFGEGKTKEMAQEYNIPFLGALPIQPEISVQGDKGLIEEISGESLDIDRLLAQIQK
ncbi:MAG: Mrp/NBP35 family ATP-binding protein [Clostridia bacterium]|nr:Mrp/NBP35 family ATP-binding protein [Clostridia bacterium]